MCLSDKLRITEYEVFYTTHAEIDICDLVSLNQMIRQIAPDLLKPITTEEYPTPASRPAYSVLDCSKTLNEFGISPSDWREGIQEVLYKMKNIK
jgi:dTDP-4-dehydrorhamnose reductase